MDCDRALRPGAVALFPKSHVAAEYRLAASSLRSGVMVLTTQAGHLWGPLRSGLISNAWEMALHARVLGFLTNTTQ